MLYGDTKYIKEFADAAVISFGEFSENYKKFLVVRDETNFRKAGHKIKPVAIMLGLEMIVNEYEHAKTLLNNSGSDQELANSADKIQTICDSIIEELNQIN